MDNHTLQQVIDLAVKTAVLQAKKEAILECRPIGSYFITETDDDPNVIFGGGWQKLPGMYVLQSADDKHAAGTTVEAGLPEISGGFQGVNWSENDDTLYTNDVYGGFTQAKEICNGERINPIWDNGSGVRRVKVALSASKSNPIYGKSNTVQPPARFANVWKRVS